MKTTWDGASDQRFDAYGVFGERDRRMRRSDKRVDSKQTGTVELWNCGTAVVVVVGWKERGDLGLSHDATHK